MAMSKVTFKGQVTIPKEIRRALGIETGDSLLFQIEDAEVRLRRVKRANVPDLYGAFPVTTPFPGVQEVRAEVEKRIAEHVSRKLD